MEINLNEDCRQKNLKKLTCSLCAHVIFSQQVRGLFHHTKPQFDRLFGKWCHLPPQSLNGPCWSPQHGNWMLQISLDIEVRLDIIDVFPYLQLKRSSSWAFHRLMTPLIKFSVKISILPLLTLKRWRYYLYICFYLTTENFPEFSTVKKVHLRESSSII